MFPVFRYDPTCLTRTDFVPTRIGREDHNLCAIEAALLDRILQTVESIMPLVPREHTHFVEIIQSTLTSSKAINVGDTLDKDLLAQELADLKDKRALLLYVKQQNAAVLVYKDTEYV